MMKYRQHILWLYITHKDVRRNPSVICCIANVKDRVHYLNLFIYFRSSVYYSQVHEIRRRSGKKESLACYHEVYKAT